jgi:hypothetical protein
VRADRMMVPGRVREKPRAKSGLFHFYSPPAAGPKRGDGRGIRKAEVASRPGPIQQRFCILGQSHCHLATPCIWETGLLDKNSIQRKISDAGRRKEGRHNGIHPRLAIQRRGHQLHLRRAPRRRVSDACAQALHQCTSLTL